jgi:hypothetical protein
MGPITLFAAKAPAATFQFIDAGPEVIGLKCSDVAAFVTGPEETIVKL